MLAALQKAHAPIDFFELEDAARGIPLLLCLCGERIRLCVRVVSAVLHGSTKARRLRFSEEKHSLESKRGDLATGLLLPSLDGLADEYLAVARAGDCAFDEQQVLLCVDARNLKVEHADEIVAVLTRHLEPWKRATWRHVRADRTTVTAVLVGAVRLHLAREAPLANNAREAASPGAALRVYLLADLKELVEFEHATDFELVGEGGVATKFFKLALWRDVGLLVVAKLWLVGVLLFALAKAEYEGGVAVAFDGALVDHGDRASFDDSDTLDGAIIVEDLRAAEFDTDHARLLIHRLTLPFALRFSKLRPARKVVSNFGWRTVSHFVLAVSSDQTGD